MKIKCLTFLKFCLLAASVFYLPGCSESKGVLYLQVLKGDRDSLVKYIKQGFDVNEVQYGNTLLNKVACLNMPMLVTILLDNGANPNVVIGDGETPLMNAAAFSKPEIVQLLIKHGADVKIRDERGDNVVWYAVGGDPENIYLLVSQGADVNNIDKNGVTPLLKAVDYHEKTGRGYVTIMILTSLGAEVNCTNSDGQTPLVLAAKNNDANIIQLLTQHQKINNQRN